METLTQERFNEMLAEAFKSGSFYLDGEIEFDKQNNYLNTSVRVRVVHHGEGEVSSSDLSGSVYIESSARLNERFNP